MPIPACYPTLSLGQLGISKIEGLPLLTCTQSKNTISLVLECHSGGGGGAVSDVHQHQPFNTLRNSLISLT